MYEIRFAFDDVTTMVTKKFSKKKLAEDFYNDVVSIGNKENKHGEVAFWNKGWLEKTTKF